MKCKRILSALLALVLMAGMIPSASAAETTSNVLLFDYTGYTTTLSSQLAVKYKPNGTGSSVTAYPIYSIGLPVIGGTIHRKTAERYYSKTCQILYYYLSLLIKGS